MKNVEQALDEIAKTERSTAQRVCMHRKFCMEKKSFKI